MTVYEKLKKQEVNFWIAAKHANDPKMRDLWIHRAREIRDRINLMSIEDASKKVKN